MVSVLIADDQDLVRAGLRALLTNDPDIDVVAEAQTGGEAVSAVKKYCPNVVLMDIRMPGMDGVAATREICRDPDMTSISRVLVLTTFDDDEDTIDAIRAGAAGYLLKDTSSADLRHAVKAVADGDNPLSPQITRKLMRHVAAAPSFEADDIDLSELTMREIEVLTRVANGDTNAEIATRLYLSPATARTYVSRILTKLQARDRTELAIIGHRAGLYSHGD